MCKCKSYINKRSGQQLTILLYSVSNAVFFVEYDLTSGVLYLVNTAL